MKLALLVSSFLVSPIAAAVCPAVTTATAADQLTAFNGFVQQFYVAKDVKGSFDTYVDVNVTEHNPYGKNGRDNTIASLSGLIPSVNITVLHNGLVSNIGYVHYRVDIPGGSPPIAYVDIYRYSGACIVEHWDVDESLPADATNPAALF